MTIMNENDKEEFCDQIRIYRNNMFRIAMGVLRNNVDAEDAVSESIVNAYEHIETLRDYSKFRPWVMRITVNEAYRIAKKRNYYDLWSDGNIPDIPFKDHSNELWSVVSKLENDFRIVVILYYYEDCSLKEISSILSIPTGTVKSRLSRAKCKLKIMI